MSPLRSTPHPKFSLGPASGVPEPGHGNKHGAALGTWLANRSGSNGVSQEFIRGTPAYRFVAIGC